MTILSNAVRGLNKEGFTKPQWTTELIWGTVIYVSAMLVAKTPARLIRSRFGFEYFRLGVIGIQG